MENLLEEILKWQRVQGIKIVREILPKLLDTEQKKIVYELTDGKNPREYIQKISGAAAGTISGWWNQWFSQGLLLKDGQKYKKIISLEELGISVTIKSQTNQIQNENLQQ